MHVFMFHDVRDYSNTSLKNRPKVTDTITPDRFEKTIKKIKLDYDVVKCSDIESIKSSGKNHEKIACLTFDDGLKDHITNVMPILLEHDLPATFFVPSAPIWDDAFVMNTHKIQHLICLVGNAKTISLISEKFGPEIFDKYSKSKFKNNIWPPEYVFLTNFFRDHPDRERVEALLDYLILFETDLTHENLNKDLYLDDRDVQTLIDNGFDIGSHGNLSVNLKNLNCGQIENECYESLSFLKSFNVKYRMISYPNGGYNDYVIKSLKSLNFRIGFTTGHSEDNLSNLYKIKRINIARHDFGI